MKILKISLVATLGSLASWWLHLPGKMWPAHPLLADVLLGLVLCTILQMVWTDAKPAMKKDPGNS